MRALFTITVAAVVLPATELSWSNSDREHDTDPITATLSERG